jgi:hypothetical protein
MVRLAAVLTALALALCAAPAFAAEEAVPAGPPACSVLIDHSSGGAGKPGLADLWVQCNYEVTEIAVSRANRKLKKVTAELPGGRPTDSMSCRLSHARRIACKGSLAALARFHARIRVDEAVCNAPRMRLTVYAFGGPTCEGICPLVGFATRTTSATDGRTMGCFGS